MKVLFITRKYPPSVGGMEQFAYELSSALAAKVDLKLVKWGRPGRLAAIFVALPYLAIRSFSVLMRGGVDVIHVHDGVLAPMGYVLSKLFRKPLVVVIHGLDITYRNPLFRLFVPPSVRRANTVVCISRAAASAAEQRRIAKARIQIIPPLISDDLYGQSGRQELLAGLNLPDHSQLLLTVGRLVERKGVAWFIDNVMPGLTADYPDIIYLVGGEGPARPDIEAAIERRGLQKQVRLLGRLSDDLRSAAFNGADVFVMPNINVPGDMEGFGLVLLEASLCELPVVAAATEGILDAVTDGRNGRLVPVHDAAAFQQQIGGFLKDGSAAASFGAASRRFSLDHFERNKLSQRYIDIYQELIEH
jgi:phosphatidylinositol alpha-1,6-mannosyltransferase